MQSSRANGAMTQITIRKLDPLVIEGLKRRAIQAGHSMEEEIRRILSGAILETGLARQRIALERLAATRKAIFGNRLFADSNNEFRKMRDERARSVNAWALPQRRKRRT
jgi:plasmid stability protein